MNKSFNLKLVSFSLIVFATISCNSTPTKVAENSPVQKVQSKKIVSTSKPVIKHSASAPVTNTIPAWRRAASHTLTRGSKDAIFPAAKEGNLELLKQLLAEGTPVDYQNFNGETVLHVAASRGDLKMVKFLVSKGADVNAFTGKRWQPIHHAMRFEHPEVANYLISHKASLLTKTSDGFTALELAKASKKSGIEAIIKKYTP